MDLTFKKLQDSISGGLVFHGFDEEKGNFVCYLSHKEFNKAFEAYQRGK